MICKCVLSAATTAIIFLLVPEVRMSRIEALSCVYFLFAVSMTAVEWVGEIIERRRKQNV